MFGDYSQDLLRQGIIEFKAGNRAAARRYLDRALYMSADHDVIAEAWYWMSQASDDPAEKRTALENCLANDLHHARARRALAILDGRLRPDEIIDPDKPLPVPEASGEAQRFMCAKCGGRMVYAPDGNSLVCEYCRRHQRVDAEQGRGAGEDFIVAMATRRGHAKPLQEQVMRCQGCGAEFMLAPGALSFACAYCDSPYVVSVTHAQGLIEPDGIIPHALDQRRAAEILTGWLSSMQIEPQSPPKTPRGLYVPIWSFDLGGAIDYSGEVVQDEAPLQGRRARAITVKDRFPVMMTVSVAASRRPSAALVRLMAGFEAGSVQPYDPRYLAAWPAELYDVPMAEASLEARSQAYTILKRDLPDRLLPLKLTSTSSANLAIDRFRLDLVPVWTAELFVEGRGGIVLINGQSGAVSGDAFRRGSKSRNGMTVWLRDLISD